MSTRIDQPIGEGVFMSNPSKKFLTFKNNYTKETVTVKGKKSEVVIFDNCTFQWSEKIGEDYVTHDIELPIEFAILNGDWVNFKGWDKTTESYYYSNEVKTPDAPIHIRNKDKVVYTFTLNDMWGVIPGSKIKNEAKAREVKAKLKELNVRQNASIYIAMKNEEGVYEINNIQLKGSNLSGLKDKTILSGWWNVSRKLKNSKKIYTHFIEINDFFTESGELGEYGIPNITLGEKIDEDTLEILETLFQELTEYHKIYEKTAIAPEATLPESKEEEEKEKRETLFGL